MSQIPPTQPMMAAYRPHRGVMILVFGILSFFICVIFGIVAWVMGNNDLREMDEGTMDPSGRGLTQAGKICGMISVFLSILGILIGLAWIVIVFVIVGASAAAGGP
jgi:hypothetical protein